MKLFSSYIYNGYFKVFFLNGNTRFSWYLTNDQGDSVLKKLFWDKTFADFTISGASRMATRITRPQLYSVYTNPDSSLVSYYKPEEDTLVGFFKSNLAAALEGQIEYYQDFELHAMPGGFVFTDFTNAPMSTFYQIDNAFHHMDGPLLINPINYSVNSSGGWVDPLTPTSSAIASDWNTHKLGVRLTGASADQIRVTGGRDATSNFFGAGEPCEHYQTNFVMPKCFKILMGLDVEGGLIPFQGPYQKMLISTSPNRYDYIKVSDSTTNPETHTNIKWSLLPGVTDLGVPSNSIVSGTDVFAVPHNFIADSNDSESISCKNTLVTGTAALIGNQTDPQPINQFIEVANTALAPLNNHHIILCPYKLVAGIKEYYPSGIKSNSTISNSFPVGPPITLTNLPATITEGVCFNVDVDRGTMSGSASISLPAGNNDVKFIYYTTSGCLTANIMPANILNMSPGTAMTTIGMKAYVSGSRSTVPITATASGYQPYSQNLSITEAVATIFVTNALYNAVPGGGIIWGDTHCLAAANSATGLPSSSNWKAVLSTSSVDAVNHIGPIANKQLHNTRGEKIADGTTTGTTAFFSFTNLLARVYGEDRAQITTGQIWTGSDSLGTGAGIPNNHCSDWTVNGVVNTSLYGAPDVLGSNRMNDGGSTITCDLPHRFYCIDTNLTP